MPSLRPAATVFVSSRTALRAAPCVVGLTALLSALPGAGGVALADPPPQKVASPAPASDQAKRQKQAMALHDEAWALFEEGHYRAAIDKLEEALRVDPEGKELVYNLALLHERLAEPKRAQEYYRRYLEMETDAKARSQTQAALRRLEGMEKDIAPAPPPAPPPPPPPRPVRPWVVATGGVAGVAFLTGSIFGLTALAKNPGKGAATRPGVTIQDLQDDARSAHTLAVVADVSFLVMLAAAGTATFLYFSTPRPAASTGTGSGTTPGAVPYPSKPPTTVAVGPGLVRVSF